MLFVSLLFFTLRVVVSCLVYSVTEEQFWRNYFYRVSLIKQSAQLSAMAQQTGENICTRGMCMYLQETYYSSSFICQQAVHKY